MNNEIQRKITSLTIMTIMIAGGMTIAAPGIMPDAAAANQLLFVSAENAAFANTFGGGQIVEIIVQDANIADTEVKESSPTVEINGDAVIMAQGDDGYWYAYVASGAGVDLLAGDGDRYGYDFGTHVATSAANGDYSNSGASSIWHTALVIGGEPALSAYTGADTGQVGLANSNEWPFVQVYDLTAGAAEIVLEKSGADESVLLDYSSMEDFASISVDRSSAPPGSEVHLTITDYQLNIDPTSTGTLTFGIAGKVMQGDGTSTTALGLQDLSTPNGCDTNCAFILTDDVNGTDILTQDATADDATSVTDLYVFTETAANSGVFVNTDDNDDSSINIAAGATRGLTATINYNDSAVSYSVANFTGVIDLDESSVGDEWNSGESMSISLTDEDLNTNSASEQTIDFSSTNIPTIVTGSPVSATTDNAARVLAVTDDDTNLNAITGTLITALSGTEIRASVDVSDCTGATGWTLTADDDDLVYATSTSTSSVVAVTTANAPAGAVDLDLSVDGAAASGLSCNVAVDIMSFGPGAHDAVYRLLLIESGDDTGVFEGSVEYVMLNQLNSNAVADLPEVTTNSDAIAMVLADGSTGTSAPRIIYSDTDSDGQATGVADQADASTHNGVVSFDSNSYKVADTVTVTVEDMDLNADSELIDVYTVNTTTDTVGDGTANILAFTFGGNNFINCTVSGADPQGLEDTGFTLAETDVASGIFTGTFQIPQDVCVTSTTDQSSTGLDLDVTYTDFLDASGNLIEVGTDATISAVSGSVSLDRQVYPVPWVAGAFLEHDAATNIVMSSAATAGSITVTISVTDQDYNTSPTGEDTIASGVVKLFALRGTTEVTLDDTLILTETTPDSGVFEVGVTVASVVNDGVDTLTLKQGDILNVTYADPTDASGNAYTNTDSSTLDLRTGSLTSDKSVYVRGSEAILSIVDADLNLDSGTVEGYSLGLVEWDSDGGEGDLDATAFVSAFSADPNVFRETGENTGVFQTVIEIPTTLTTDLDSGEKIALEYVDYGVAGEDNYSTTSTEDIGLTIYTSNFGATIELDKKVYTWTDRVFVNITAPDHNTDSGLVNEIGGNSTLTAQTRSSSLTNYKLTETGPDTGIFSGEITLVGFAHDADGVSGNEGPTQTQVPAATGPTNGYLGASDSDGVTVSFTYSEDQTVISSSLVRWNISEVAFSEDAYLANSSAIVTVSDIDMNLNPDAVENFEVELWSDSDSGGIDLTVTETSESTGVFEGTVYFTTTDASSGHTLRVSEGDTITTSYGDNTLPTPYSASDELEVTATAVIGTIVPPLERAPAANLRTVDAFGTDLSVVSVDQQIQLQSDLANGSEGEQAFAYLVQIQNDSGVTVQLAWITGTLATGQSMSPALSWIPTESGSYTATAFVWESVSNPTALSASISTTITVE